MYSFLHPAGGDCIYAHSSALVLNILGNLGVTLAYALIPAALVLFALAVGPSMAPLVDSLLAMHPELAIVVIHGRRLIYEFALFVLFCGATHGFTDYTFYHHAYFELGVLECITAAISLVVAAHLIYLAVSVWGCLSRDCSVEPEQ